MFHIKDKSIVFDIICNYPFYFIQWYNQDKVEKDFSSPFFICKFILYPYLKSYFPSQARLIGPKNPSQKFSLIYNKSRSSYQPNLFFSI